MQKEYATIDSVHIRMTIQAFESEAAKNPFYEEVADINRQYENYSYRIGTLQMLMNSNCVVMVDKKAREIVYTRRSPEEEKKFFNDPFKLNLDSILTLYEGANFIGNESEGERYRAFQKQGPIRQIDLVINPVENRLSKIEYRYEDDHYVKIRFAVFDKHPIFEPDTFSEKRYVSDGNGKMVAASAFRGYRVAVVDGK